MIVKNLKTRARAEARNLTLDALSTWRSVSGRDRKTFQRPRIYFPYLHKVPKGEEVRFRQFLEMLSESHEFLTYSEAVERVLHGPIDKPYVAFSFDDGFESNVSASRILEEYGARGCFFIPPGFIDKNLSATTAMNAFETSRGSLEGPMTWNDLEEMKSRGHEIGNHTMNHTTLSSISEHKASEEISDGAERIREILGECRHFAWPRGRFKHMTDMAVRTVFDTGHVSCASAVRGSHVQSLDDDARLLCIRRDHIMTSWPLRHNKYFVDVGSANASLSSNVWPDGWCIQ